MKNNNQITEEKEVTRKWITKAVFILLVSILLASIIIPMFTDYDIKQFEILISTLSGLFDVVLGYYFRK